MRCPIALLVLAGLVAIAPPALADIPLCLTVQTDDEAAGLTRLVRDELLHFRSHHLVDSDCTTTLTVELFSVGGVRYLTARTSNEVPVRFAVKNLRELPEKLNEALRQVLAAEPEYLSQDLGRYSAMQRAALTVLRQGHNTYRVELFELIVYTGTGAGFATGGALAIHRGAGHWQVFSRLLAAGAAGDVPAGQNLLRFIAGGEVGAMYEVSARRTATLYLGLGIGVFTMQLLGQPAGNPPPDAGLATALKVDGAVTPRIGVRFLRQYSFDLDVFAVGTLPLTNAQDVDSQLPRSYTASLQLGMGVGF